VKKFFFLFVCALYAFELFSQEIGDKVYKEINVDGKKQYKWLIYRGCEEYDLKGRVIVNKFSWEYKKSGWNYSSQPKSDYYYVYDKHVKEIVYEYDANDRLVKEKVRIVSDCFDKEKNQERKYEIIYKYVLEYNAAGKVTKEIKKMLDFSNDDSVKEEETEVAFEYDSNGKMIKKIYDADSYEEFDLNGILVFEKKGENIRKYSSKKLTYEQSSERNGFVYKGDNLLYEKTSDDWEVFYDGNGHQLGWGIPSKRHFSDYDDNGNVIHFWYEEGREFWHEYDEKGNLLHSIMPEGENIYKYDKDGRCVFEQVISDHIPNSITYREFDPKGRVIHEIQKNVPVIRSNDSDYRPEHWYKYSSDDKLIYEKNGSNETYYEYELFPNNQVKIKRVFDTFKG